MALVDVGTAHSRKRPERVRRTPLNDYSQLDRLASNEHRAWQRRAAASARKRLTGPIKPSVHRRVETVSQALLSVTQSLGDVYGTPDLGNKPDPVDELVYIILSRRTREGAYQAAFSALRTTYGSWEDLAWAPPDEIFEAIRFSGLGRRKAHSLKLALGALIERFGRCTLHPTIAWDDDQARDFLCELPEIGPKSAACIMVCSLDRPAFPVDAHVGRVLERLAILDGLGIHLTGDPGQEDPRLRSRRGLQAGLMPPPKSSGCAGDRPAGCV